MNYIKIAFIICLFPFSALAKDYNASLFGAKSDGTTLNTKSIQKGIDFISENGGGTLVFYVGRYLTGAIQLKSNVKIKLEEGAVLVGSGSIYDYNSSGSIKAIISAAGQQNIGISGKGVIEGRGAFLLDNMKALKQNGFLLDSLTEKPALLGFENCTGISVDSVNLLDAAGAVQVYNKCSDVSIATVTVKSRSVEASVGAVFEDNKNIKVINTYFDVPGNAVQWLGDNKEVLLEKAIQSNGQLIKKANE